MRRYFQNAGLGVSPVPYYRSPVNEVAVFSVMDLEEQITRRRSVNTISPALHFLG